MISADTLFTLTPATTPAVNGGEQLEASAVKTAGQKSGCSFITSARAGDVHSARGAGLHKDARATTIIDDAKRVVIKELIALHGKDIPCVRKFRRYLETLSLTDLCARRDLFLQERLPIQLELGEAALKNGGKL